MNPQDHCISGSAFARLAVAGAITKVPAGVMKMASSFVWNFRYRRWEMANDSIRVITMKWNTP